MTFSDRLQAILSTLHASFHPNELAYLAATSKVEGQIRDRIAYQLHVQLEPGLFVHREIESIYKAALEKYAVANEAPINEAKAKPEDFEPPEEELEMKPVAAAAVAKVSGKTSS